MSHSVVGRKITEPSAKMLNKLEESKNCNETVCCKSEATILKELAGWRFEQFHQSKNNMISQTQKKTTFPGLWGPLSRCEPCQSKCDKRRKISFLRLTKKNTNKTHYLFLTKLANKIKGWKVEKWFQVLLCQIQCGRKCGVNKRTQPSFLWHRLRGEMVSRLPLWSGQSTAESVTHTCLFGSLCTHLLPPRRNPPQTQRTQNCANTILSHEETDTWQFEKALNLLLSKSF